MYRYGTCARMVLLVSYMRLYDCVAKTLPRERRGGGVEYGRFSSAQREEIPRNPRDNREVLAVETPQNFRVVGRARLLAAGASFDHPGVSVLARFTGTSLLTATMSKVGNITSAFVVYCDGKRMAGGRYGASTFNTSNWPSDGEHVNGIRLCGNLDPAEEHEVQVNL
jgi:hypothetical protein